MTDVPNAPLFFESELVATTTSMVHNNLSAVRDWIDGLKAIYGVYPIVFVDEAHTASDLTAWGQTIKDLADAHAFIVLCTATPYRTDGRPIPGFQIETISEEDLEGSQRLGAHVYARRGRKVVYRLVAHHTTTFQQAWQESVLCKVSRETFDVDLREHGMDGYEDHMLSALGETSSRRALHEAVRQPVVVREGIRRLVTNLRYRRNGSPETAGIVFVGADDGSDEDGGPEDSSNQYASMVQDAIQDEASGEFKVVIATSKIDGDPAQAIETFSEGPHGGDILVVKMMASAGLDIARLKVALDLSTVRTPVSYVQRVMRACTRWERDQGEPVLWATYITPDECRGRVLYDELIHDLGGAASHIEWDPDLGGSIDGGGGKPPLTTWEATGTQEGEVLTDSDGTVAPGSTRPYVDEIFSANRDLDRVVGKAALGQAIDKAAQAYATAHLNKPASTQEEAQTPTTEVPDDGFIDDIQGRMESMRKDVVSRVKARAAKELRKADGDPFTQQRLGAEIRDTWRWLYPEAGISWPSGVKQGQLLGSLGEPELSRLLATLKTEE